MGQHLLHVWGTGNFLNPLVGNVRGVWVCVVSMYFTVFINPPFIMLISGKAENKMRT